MKPIEFPIAVVLWLGLATFTLAHNWGWWRANDMGFWPDLLFGLTLGGLVLLICAGGLFGAASGIASFVGNKADLVWRQSWHATMASMRNADGVQGSVHGGLFILSGSIESRETYFYYTTDGPNRYKPRRWTPDGDTTVIEENRKDGEVCQFETAFKKSWVTWFGITNSRLRMDFHIPKGSLIHRFEVK